MPVGRLTGSALCGALLFPLAFSSRPALADVYHPVAAGDTLATIARRYQVTPEALKQANNLKDTAETAPLASMLLIVPGVNSRVSTSAAIAALPVAPEAEPAVTQSGFGSGGFQPAARTQPTFNYGTLGKAMVETVRPNDSWETIAGRYKAAGHDVTAEALRRRNNYAPLPAPGQTVVVPLGQITVPTQISRPAPRVEPTAVTAAVAQTLPAQTASSNAANSSQIRKLDGGVVASGELELPFASETNASTPVYQAPNGSRTQNRGNLGARGGFGTLTRAPGSDVRVLTPTEEAVAPPVAQPRAVSTRPGNVARVAKVALTDARIRRLPEASAATLYKCAVGTQLAVLREKNGWSAILMSDRSTGWVPSRYLKLTEQTVDVAAQVVTNAGPGGSVTGFAKNYAGENPMVAYALKWLGTPYRYGGTSRNGIDCSALVQNSFSAYGYRLPRTAAQQARVGAPVDPAQLKSGDRLYFSASGSRIDHTGLYMGNGLFVHASGSGRQVMVSNLFEPRNWNIFVGARR